MHRGVLLPTLSRRDKQRYYNSMLDELKPRAREYWRCLNRLAQRENKKLDKIKIGDTVLGVARC